MYLSAEIARAHVADLLRQAEVARLVRTASAARFEASKRPSVTRTVVLPVEPTAALSARFADPRTDREAREVVRVGGER